MKLQSLTTLVTLANAVELSVEVTRKVIGNEVSDTLNGSELKSDLIRQHIVTELQSNMTKVIGS